MKYCKKCGKELRDEATICPDCFSTEFKKPETTENANVEVSNLPIIIGVIIGAIVIIIGIVILITGKNYSKKQYLEYADEFLSSSYNCAARLQNVTDMVQNYWNEEIWKKDYDSETNKEIASAILDFNVEMEAVKIYNTSLQAIYSHTNEILDNVSAKDKDELKEICSACKELYNAWSDYYNFATNPTGTKYTYCDKINSYSETFFSKANILKNLLKK